MIQPFNWDEYSDQAGLLKDKVYKKKMRKKALSSLVKTFLISLVIFPISLVLLPFIKRKQIDSESFFCMGVDYQREEELTLKLLDELDVKRILVRIKLWEMDTLPDLKKFLVLNKHKSRKITLKIMQDREHIEDAELTSKDFKTIFATLDKLVDIYEVGTTINRTKWGFFSIKEYNEFYKVAYDLKSEFNDITLIGSCVIDFEYHFTVHTLFNFVKSKYDGVSSLLYVDRRGAPENTQMGFNLSDKIAWLNSIVNLSRKTANNIHITETNWPISNTAQYAPTSEVECVSEDLYADYMLRYYLLAFASQQIESVSWHQLIARGYGLVDNVDGIKIRKAFRTYKYMFSRLRKAQFLRLDITRDYYILQCLINGKLLQIHWSLTPTTLKNEDYFSVCDMNGEKLEQSIFDINSSPIYVDIVEAVGLKINCI